mgnify:CR=1 FL=1
MLINPYIYAPTTASEFIFTVDTTQTGSATDTFVLQLHSGTTSMTVSWGDGNSDVITAYNQAELTHVYASSGTYQISCDGAFAGLLYQSGDKLKISSVDNWGANAFTLMNYAFQGCANMVINATDEPNFTGCTNFTYMLQGCTSLNSAINWTTTNNVTNFSNFMNGCTGFNSSISLNTDSATNMTQMFFGCTIFNSSVTFSNTLNVGSMFQMFMSCSVFNQPLTFDCTSLTTIYRMFLYAFDFNGVLTFTRTANLQNAFQAFYSTSFDQDISYWDIGGLTDATGMLQNSSFSTTNYDLLLVAWNAFIAVSVPFHAGTAQYSAGAPATAHASMISRGWTITDGGPV